MSLSDITPDTGTSTLPYAWYSDPEIFTLEERRIFRRSWQFVGRADQLQHRGDTLLAEVGGIPIVLVLDEDGVRAFVNACRHRGHPVVSEPGPHKRLQCPYHAWTYSLDGALKSAPRSSRESCFEKAELGLRPVSVDSYGPLVFVNVADDHESLLDFLGPVPGWLEADGIDLDEFRWAHSREYDLAANWKVFAENSLECYHCPGVHPTLGKLMHTGPDDFKISLHGKVIQMEMPYRDVAPPDGAHSPSAAPATYPYVFPNLQVFTFDDGVNKVFNVQTWNPAGPDRTTLRNDYFAAPTTSPEFLTEYTDFQDSVVLEDKPIVEAVHATMRTGALAEGHLLLDSERAIRHFNDLVREALG